MKNQKVDPLPFGFGPDLFVELTGYCGSNKVATAILEAYEIASEPYDRTESDPPDELLVQTAKKFGWSFDHVIQLQVNRDGCDKDSLNAALDLL